MFPCGAEIPGDFPWLQGDNALVRTMRLADREELEAGHGELEAVIRVWRDKKARLRAAAGTLAGTGSPA